MQTSKNPMLKICLALLATALVVGIANHLLTYLFAPYGSIAFAVWHNYNETRDENYDTVLIGSSYTIYNVSTSALDEGLGSTSINTGTPAQSVGDALSSLRIAYADHQIKRAIMCIGYETFTLEPEIRSALGIALGRTEGRPFWERAAALAEVAFDPAYRDGGFSVASFFPWSITMGADPVATAQKQLRLRATYENPTLAVEENDPAIFYAEPGRAIPKEKFNNFPHQAGNIWMMDEYPAYLTVDTDAFYEICDFCAKNAIELVVVVTPKPAYEVVRYAEFYPKHLTPIRDAVLACGGIYLDFNLIHKDIYFPKDTEYADPQHLNVTGATNFTPLLASYIKRAESSENVLGDFYSYEAFDEYLASVDYISNVRFWQHLSDGRIVFDAVPFTGSKTQVEYEYQLKQGDEWVTVHEYSTDPHFEYEVNGHGTLSMSVNARVVGSSELWERYYVEEISY